MKKFLFTFIIAIFFGFNSKADIAEKHCISFSMDDFPMSTDANGNLLISSRKIAVYSEANEPGLPSVSTDIAVDGTRNYVSSSVRFEKKLIQSGVKLSSGPLPVPASEVSSCTLLSLPDYSMTTYPSSSCQYLTTSRWDGLSVFHFLSCPFIYDTAKKELYFIENMELEIRYENGDPSLKRKTINSQERALIKSKVINPERVDGVTSASNSINSYSDRLDYLIITSETLKPAFMPLINWKRTKGLYSEIVTVEDIAAKYNGKDLQEKIKRCLYSLYANNDLQYVLLGGDDSVVPVRGCYGKVAALSGDYEDITIPADIYYTCFEDNFIWDGNGNGIYGEKEDNINLSSSINICRLPVRSAEHVSNYTEKLFIYEKSPRFNNQILLSGVQVSYYDSLTNRSDVEIAGGILSDNYIQPYWNGYIERFYDSYTSFMGGEQFDVTVSNLKDVIKRGFYFIEMNTHGSQRTWAMESGGSYNSIHASSQTNPFHSFIFTEACNTNAFDNSANCGSNDPCLSEAFIRNKESGVLGYWGSSRLGWNSSVKSDQLNYCQLFNGTFFDFLFGDSQNNKSYGEMIRLSKLALLPKAISNNAYRWLYYSLNGMGDPEMHVYSCQPKMFENFNFSHHSDNIFVYTGIADNNICMTSNTEGGVSILHTDTFSSSIKMTKYPMQATICLTKPGFIPMLFSYVLLQNKEILNDTNYSADLIKTGASLCVHEPSGNLEFKNGKHELIAKEIVLEPGTVINKGAVVTIKNK